MVTVGGSGGTLALTFQDMGGVDPNFTLQALDIRPTTSVLGITFNPMASTVVADGQTMDTITGMIGGVGLPANSEVTVTSSLGTLQASDDVDPNYAGVQVKVMSNSFTFHVTRPSGAGTSTWRLTSDWQGPRLDHDDVHAAHRRHYDSTPRPARRPGLPCPCCRRPTPPPPASAGSLPSGPSTAAEPTPCCGRPVRVQQHLPDGPAQRQLRGDRHLGRRQLPPRPGGRPGRRQLGAGRGVAGQRGRPVRHPLIQRHGQQWTTGLQFKDQGGSDPNFVVNALDITPFTAAGTITLTRTSPGGTGSLEADGLSVDTYAGSGAVPNSVLTLTAMTGAGAAGKFTEVSNTSNTFSPPVTDVSPSLAGVQVQADGSGNFQFHYLRPTGTSTVTLTAQDVTGLAFGTAMQGYTLPQATPPGSRPPSRLQHGQQRHGGRLPR